MGVPEHDCVLILNEDVVDAHVLSGEPAIRVGDVVGIVNRLPEDQGQEVVAGVDLPAPPVAVLATKSSAPPSRTGFV